MSGSHLKQKLPFIHSPAFTLVLLFFFLFLTIALIKETAKFINISRQLSSARKDIVKLEEKNQNMASELNYLQDDFSKEKEAREKLNMLKPGEKKIIIQASGKNLENKDWVAGLTLEKKSLWQKIGQWVNSLFNFHN